MTKTMKKVYLHDAIHGAVFIGFVVAYNMLYGCGGEGEAA